MAAAAAIADEFAALRDPSADGEGTSQAEESWDVVAPDSQSEPSQSEPFVVAETSVANPEPACSVGEDADANLEPDRSSVGEIVAADPDHSLTVAEDAAANPEVISSFIPEIVFVDLEPDHALVVVEDAAANPEAEADAIPEIMARDSQLNDAAAACDDCSSADANVAPMPLRPVEGQLHKSASEALAVGQAVSMVVNGDRLPDNLFGEIVGDQSSTGQTIEALEEELPANQVFSPSEEARFGALQGVKERSVDMIAVKLEAALSEHVELDVRERSIALRAEYYDNRFSENAGNVERRMASRSRRKAEVHARSSRRFIPRWPLSNLHTGIVALALLDVFLVDWRTDIVRKLPQTASFYALAGLPVNLRGLAFENITTSAVRDDGTPVLVVEGNVINDTRKNVRVPQIRFVVRDAAAQEIYSWTDNAARTSLPPGQAATFRTRLASPPPGAHDLVLRFVSRRDDIAVIR